MGTERTPAMSPPQAVVGSAPAAEPRLRRQLLGSLLVQGTGAAAVLLATLWVGYQHGPAVQGRFNAVKSLVDWLAAVAMLGLPQAVFFYLRKQAMPHRRAAGWCLLVAVLGLAVGVAVAGAGAGVTGLGLPAALVLSGIWLGVAVAAASLHGVLRTMVLARGTVRQFNVVTAMPQWGLLAAALVVSVAAPAAGLASGAIWAVVLGGVYVASAVWAGVVWRRLQQQRPESVLASPQDGRAAASAGHASAATVLRYGVAAWLTAVCATGALVITQRGLSSSQGDAALGLFMMAYAVAQVVLTPVNYAVPVLFRRWVDADPGRWHAGRLALWCIGGIGLPSLAVAAWLPQWPMAMLGDYAALSGWLGPMLVAVAFECAQRLLAVEANAAGRPGWPLAGEVLRCALLATGAWWLPAVPVADAGVRWGGLWLAGAVTSAAVLLLGRARHARHVRHRLVP